MPAQLELYTMLGNAANSRVMALLKELNIPYVQHELRYFDEDHLKEDIVKMSPQREVPILKDGNFYINESVAIMQYICDSYGGEEHESLYPKDPKKRAIVNQRLLFNLCNFHPNVASVISRLSWVGCDVPNKVQVKTKALRILAVLETILEKQCTTYSAGDSFTIADITLMSSVMYLEAVSFNFTPYPCIANWYKSCKNLHPVAWSVIEENRDHLRRFLSAPVPKEDYNELENMRHNSFKDIVPE